jgi:hypothetical protein
MIFSKLLNYVLLGETKSIKKEELKYEVHFWDKLFVDQYLQKCFKIEKFFTGS